MARIIGPAVPNLPWEDRPAGSNEPIWRYSQNPIIGRHATPTSNSVFNSAAVWVGENVSLAAQLGVEFAGVFRCDDRRREMRLHAGFSKDGLNWQIDPEPIQWMIDDPQVETPEYGYDPRVCWIEDRYYVTWCNGWHGPTIGLGYTFDFKTFHMIENGLLPYNRNGVLFPRKIGGRYMMLSRPSDTGHTAFGEIFLSQSDDMIHWGRHRWVMKGRQPWESTKIGAGPVPIETDEGWLIFHHGVLTSCNGYVYHFGAALLDLDEPWKVIRRGAPYLISPQLPYELSGDVPNVTFPVAAIADGATGRIAVYYGCADSVTGIAFTDVQTLSEWLIKNG